MIINDLYPIKPNTNAIVDKLERYGVCFIENFFSNNDISALNKESSDIFREDSIVPDHLKNDVIHAKNLDTSNFNFANFPTLNKIRLNQLFISISKIYLKNNYTFAKKIFLVNSRGKSKKDYLDDKKLTYVPHTDETHFLKFFIYLTDVSFAEGPLTVAPGTHIKFKKIRHEWIKKNFNPLTRDKTNYDHEHEMIPLIGKKGSLIIFDTDCLHKAGDIQESYTRKIIRFDVYSDKENYQDLFSRIYLKIKKLLRLSKIT